MHPLVVEVYKKRRPQCPCGLITFRMMNERKGEDYEYTVMEEIANVLTHAFPAVLSVFVLMYMFETVVTTSREALVAWIYGGCLCLLFFISSVYHLTGLLLGNSSKLNQLLMKMDHTIIFTFIAASCTPWCILIDIGSENAFGKTAMSCIWAFAVFGTLKSFITEFFPFLSRIALYLLMAWVSLMYFGIIYYLSISGSLVTELAVGQSFMELVAGVLIYGIGLLIFGLDGRVPFAHAIWHCFVVAAAGFHVHAVCGYLMILE